MPKAVGWVVFSLTIAALLVGGVAWYLHVPCWRCVLTPNRYHPAPGPGYDFASPHSLKTLTSAQADFRAYDRDGNGLKDFWRKDLAGLYGRPGADGKPLKLIPLSLALADERPACSLDPFGTQGPYRGYWYRAIRHEDEDPLKLDPQRFAYAAIPISYPRHWKWVFIVDEYNTVYRSDEPFNLSVSVFPKDPLKAGWLRVD